MSSFSDLYRRFPRQMFGLLMEECCRDRRPVFMLDTYDEGFDCRCEWCDRQALFIFIGYDDQDFDPPLPNMTREQHCGSRECATAQSWFYDERFGAHRRKKYFQRFGERIWLEEAKDMRLAKALSVILESENRNVGIAA